jgi:hypothetical protein
VTFWIQGRVIKTHNMEIEEFRIFSLNIRPFPCLGFKSCSFVPSLPRPAFPASLLVPTPETKTHIRGFRLSPGPLVGVTRSVTICQLVGCDLPGESESDGLCGFMVVMWMYIAS